MKLYRLIIFMGLLFVIIMGLFSKFYSGLFSTWINNYVASIFYEIFWVWLGALIWPSISPSLVAIWVFIATSVLEFMQLWNPRILTIMRSHILGKLLLGTSFDWWDFLYYAVGCLLAALVLITVKNKIEVQNHS